MRSTWPEPKTGLTTSPGLPDLPIASPPSFGGPGETWTPEHLFVASVSSCLMTTFHTIAEIARLKVLAYRDSASGRLVKDEDRRYRIDSVTLRPKVEVEDPTQVEKAHHLLEKAEKACLISRSIAAEVTLEPVVKGAGNSSAVRGRCIP